MRIILCDDDIPFTQSFAKRLSSAFKDLGIKPEIIVTNTGIDALRQFTQKPTDALFLDIDMPDQDGFSVANELMKMRTKPLIIFLSSLEHLVYQSFAFQPFWFLRKTHLEDLPMVLEKMTKVINNTKVHYTATINGSNISIPISEIFYFESEGHYIIAHRNGSKLRYKAPISDIERELSRYFFVRCHVGYLVNCRFIQICSRTTLTLTTGQVIPVSRAQAAETQSAFMTYMRSLRP